MSFSAALRLTELMTSLALILTGFEFLILAHSRLTSTIWSTSILEREISESHLGSSGFTRWLSSEKALSTLALAEIMVALYSAFLPTTVSFAALFLVHLLICIRFRGNFNGGSDSMIFVLLTGLLVATSVADVNIAKYGLIYIAVQILFSYLKSGLVKLRSESWWKPAALARFLERSTIRESKDLAEYLFARPSLSKFLVLVLIAFEITAPVSAFNSSLTRIYFFGAVIFHFTVWRTYSLNRFFWAWLAAWPSVFFLSSLP